MILNWKDGSYGPGWLLLFTKLEPWVDSKIDGPLLIDIEWRKKRKKEIELIIGALASDGIL